MDPSALWLDPRTDKQDKNRSYMQAPGYRWNFDKKQSSVILKL